MSVPNQTPYNIYTANGLTTVFPYEFYLLNAGDLAVSLNGSVITSGYTISGVGNVDGGEVSFLTPPANGVTVMLERLIPTYRLTDYQDNGDLLADTVNQDFDRLWMAIQQAFIYLGLALTRPLLGGPFNAKNYRIENLGSPLNPHDAASKSYVDLMYQYGKGYTDDQLKRTLRSPAGEVLNQLPAASVRRGKFQAYDTQNGQPILVNPEKTPSDVWIKLGSINGYSYIGGFFSQETSGAYGNGSYDLVSWRGERGQFDQTQGIATQVTGAGVSFGGIQNRGMVVVGPGGALFSQLMLEGRPYSDLVASAYTIDANRLDAFGREVQVVKFPTKNNPTDNQCFELELYSDVNGQPKGVIRNQEKRTDLDNTGTTGDKALFIADEKLFATSSKFFAKIRIPDEVNRFSLNSCA